MTVVGTIGSFIGAIMIGLFGYVFGLSNMIVFFIIIAGFLSALFDSILGGTVQARFIFIITGEISEKQIINNHQLDKNETVFIGDSLRDKQASDTENLRFIARIADNKSALLYEPYKIRDLTKLQALLDEFN